jgi:hypothetical protein
MYIEARQIVGESEKDGIVFGRSLLVGQNRIITEERDGIQGLGVYGDFEDESIWEATIETEPRTFDDSESLAVIRGLCAYIDSSFNSIVFNTNGYRKQTQLQRLSVDQGVAGQYLRDIALELMNKPGAKS